MCFCYEKVFRDSHPIEEHGHLNQCDVKGVQCFVVTNKTEMHNGKLHYQHDWYNVMFIFQVEGN